MLSVLLAWRGKPAPTGCFRVVLVPRARLCRLAWGSFIQRQGSAGTLNLFCFLVSARQPHTHAPLVSRPVCVKGGKSGPVGASTADQSDDV